jgi:endonuclease/exonuclease/phosphatase family metal-dependent hydrolase
MVAFPKPDFPFNYVLADEIQALRNYEKTKEGRDIPAKGAGRLLVATWNIANLGVQERRPNDYKILAEIIGWFDIVTLQEVNDDLSGLNALMAQLPNKYRVLFSDASGNDERMAFIYDSNKLKQLNKVGEVSVPFSDLRYIKIAGVADAFGGFDRSPYLATFRIGSFDFLLVSVHIYFGKDESKANPKPQDMARRSLETFAVGRWCDLRRKSANAFTTNIIAMGDFNLPKVEKGDPVYDALTKRGLELPDHTTKVGSNLAGDKHYDQIAFMPGLKASLIASGVFDFDGALFAKLWKKGPAADYRKYVKYYISDHRPLWAAFALA